MWRIADKTYHSGRYQYKSADAFYGERLRVRGQESDEALPLLLQGHRDRLRELAERGEGEGGDAAFGGRGPGAGDETVDGEGLRHVAVLADDDLAVIVADDAGAPPVAEQEAVPLGQEADRGCHLGGGARGGGGAGSRRKDR